MKKSNIWILVIVLSVLASGLIIDIPIVTPIVKPIKPLIIDAGRGIWGLVEEARPTSTSLPKMNGTEVCQYVNEALPNEYIHRSPALRYEYRYTALSTRYIGGSNHYQEGVWEVSVRETVEYQCLYEGQWTLFHKTSPQSQTVKYIFNETTGAVTRQ